MSIPPKMSDASVRRMDGLCVLARELSWGFGVSAVMLFMVIEHFKAGGPGPVGERFRRCGRMLPDGVSYGASWVDSTATRCFQVMEASSAESLDGWVRRWDDLVDFEIVPVVTSADFWAGMPG